MAYDPRNPFPALEIPIDLFVRTGNINALKSALVDHALLDGFSDYLINLFQENLRHVDVSKAAHDLAELARDFAGNIDQQSAVMKLLPHTQS